MARRFLAIYRDTANQQRLSETSIARQTGLNPIFASHRLSVFSDAGDAHLAISHAGVIVGDVFSREDRPRPVKHISAQEASQILGSKGDRLLRTVWGGYVSLLIDLKTHALTVLRDPSGMMPCYFHKADGVLWLASDLESFFEAGVPIPEINWPHVAFHLRYADLPTQKTALTGIEELMAGCRLSAKGSSVTIEVAWSPWSHVRPRLAGDTVSELRETVAGCIQAWGDAYPKVLLGVSGGLDSSIVAASLATGSSSVSCFTLATEEAEGDERHYAEALTQSLGLPLANAFHAMTVVDVTRPTNPHLPRPGAPAFGQSGIATMLELAKAQNIDAFFTGIGGDNVFCFTQSATPLLDRFQAEGLGTGLWESLNDICRLTNCSYWDAIGGAINKARSRPGSEGWRGFDWPWLKPLGPTTEPVSHPWLAVPTDALPGKRVHIAGLVRIQGTLDSFARDDIAPQIHPLLSQPIMELCLSIPTWEWIAGGKNRAVARKAFDRYFPDMIKRRRSKGGPTHFACAVVAANLPVIRAQLMDGMLRANGILDAPAIEPWLDGTKPLLSTDHIRIAILAEAEAWARYWIDRKRQAVDNRVGPVQVTQDGAGL